MAYRKKAMARGRKGKRRTGGGGKKSSYANKKTPRFTQGSSMSPSGMSAQLAVYRNPLSTVTTCPKIPDQKAGMSAGLRLQSVQDIVFGNSTIHLMIFPGLNNGVKIIGCKGLDFAKRTMCYREHGKITTSDASLISVPANDDKITVSTREKKWRIVSQALKLTLVNNSDENDGWFECIRTACNPNEFDNVIDDNHLWIGRADNLLPGIDTTKSIVENNTYASGKLRDIHRFLFQLHPSLNSHEFRSLDIGRDGTKNSVIRDAVLDTSFDCIYMKIHGRSGAYKDGVPTDVDLDGDGVPDIAGEQTLVNPTRLMAHLVTNQEVVYDEESNMARFHTETSRAPPGVVDMVKDQLCRNNKAAKVMYGGI